MTTKRQFLDPIGAGCRFVLLKSFEPNAKLRITEHTVQIVSDTIWEKLIYRPWVYKDSREDIAALYPVIVRFIELYLMEKKPANYQINSMDQTNQQNQQNQNTLVVDNKKQKEKQTPKQKNKQKIENNFDLFGIEYDDPESFNVDDEFNDDSQIIEESDVEDNNDTKDNDNLNKNNSVEKNMEKSKNMVNNQDNSDVACYEALKTIAHYMIEGMEELQRTYEYGNAVFALQHYIDLLQSGINGTYSKKKLPKHLTDFTSQNFLDNSKIKGLWKDKEIIQLAKLLNLCFGDEEKTPTAMKAYRAAIESMLNDRDNLFKQMISSTNSS